MPRKKNTDREGLGLGEDQDRRLRHTDVEEEAEESEELLRKEGRIKK